MRYLRILAMLLVSAFGFVVFAPPAFAQLTFCNETGYPISLAVAYQQNDGWVSSGWYQIDGGHCLKALSGDLQARYYYYYAHHNGVDGIWHGDYPFCVSRNSFKIPGNADCDQNHYETKGFREIDTGDARSWTVQLAD